MPIPNAARKAFESILEELAAIEHERWSTWQRHLHSQGARQPDGSLILPPELGARWERKMQTPYESLTEAEKQSDRDQVRRCLPTIQSVIELDPSR
jgi:hypothetical protein